MSILVGGRGSGSQGSRPAGLARMNLGSVHGTGLIAWVPGQTPLVDLVSGIIPTRSGGCQMIGDPVGGQATNNNATAAIATINTLPSQRTFPMGVTLSWWGTIVGTPSTNGAFSCVSDSNTWASPFFCVGVGTDGSGNFCTWIGNSIDGAANIGSGISASSAGLMHLVATYGVDAQNTKTIYVNGRLKGTQLCSLPPSPSSTAQIIIGSDGSGTRNMACYSSDMRLWNRVLTATEIWSLYDPATRWDLYAQQGRHLWISAPAAAGGYLLVKN